MIEMFGDKVREIVEDEINFDNIRQVCQIVFTYGENTLCFDIVYNDELSLIIIDYKYVINDNTITVKDLLDIINIGYTFEENVVKVMFENEDRLISIEELLTYKISDNVCFLLYSNVNGEGFDKYTL